MTRIHRGIDVIVRAASQDHPVNAPATAAPITKSERITNLDTVRGIATLGILLMNVVSFGLVEAAYFNVSAGGADAWYDRLVGLLGEIFVDQKTMALFSLLFGVGIVVFADRAAAKGRRPVWLSLWRNLLLGGIGLLHAMLWVGDILTVYAVCSPVLLLTRKLPARVLAIAGAALLATSAVWATATQLSLDGDYAALGGFWFDGAPAESDAVGIYLLADFFLRALGMMLIGVALFRAEIVQGLRPAVVCKRMAIWGLGLGLPIATVAALMQQFNDWGPSTALVGAAVNTVATPLVALGYLGVITLWNQRPATAAHERIRAVGRMALTNYLAQTVLGIVVLRTVFDFDSLGRLALLGFVLAVWTLQIAWSQPWLERFRFGPCEWLWRVCTYRRWQPIRRDG